MVNVHWFLWPSNTMLANIAGRSYNRSTVDHSQDREATSMPISRRMDEEAVGHTHHGILLSRQKEFIWISSDEMDETAAHYTEWSTPER